MSENNWIVLEIGQNNRKILISDSWKRNPKMAENDSAKLTKMSEMTWSMWKNVRNGPSKIENFRKWMKKRENVKEFSWHVFICEDVLTFMYFTNFLTIFEPFADIFTQKNSDILCISYIDSITILPSPCASGIEKTGWIFTGITLIHVKKLESPN